MKRKALGKGLDALLPTAGISSGEASRTLTKLGIEEIHRNPRQPRQYFNKEKLHELAESIKTNGILQPIVVRKSKEGFEIVAGERRWRAAPGGRARNRFPVSSSPWETRRSWSWP